MLPELNPGRGLIFRLTHRENLPWILEHGLLCRHATAQDDRFIPIGSAELIDKRRHRRVPAPPFGTLADYVPFYFTPLSMMAFNIVTGRGVTRRDRRDLVVLVSSLPRLHEAGIRFVFTDRHGLGLRPRFSSDLADLDRIDWPLLQRRDFSRDNDDLEKTSRYQAEALVHQGLPTPMFAIACCDDDRTAETARLAEECAGRPKVVTRPSWFF